MKNPQMDIPDEFKYFTSCFWQGSDREAKNERDWVMRALKLNTQEQQTIIRSFLDSLLSGDATDEELQRIWSAGSPSYGIHLRHARAFLTLIRDAIEN